MPVVKNGKYDMADFPKPILTNDTNLFITWLEGEIKKLLTIPDNIFQQNLRTPPVAQSKMEESVFSTPQNHGEESEEESSDDDDEMNNNHLENKENIVDFRGDKGEHFDPTALTWFNDEILRQLIARRSSEVNDNGNSDNEGSQQGPLTREERLAEQDARINNQLYYARLRYLIQSKLAWASLTRKNNKARHKMKSKRPSIVSDLGSPSDLDVTDFGDLDPPSNCLNTPKRVLVGYFVTLDHKYELYNGVNRIGKMDYSDIQIAEGDDESISKEHAIIYISSEMGWYLKLQSYRSPTFIHRVNIIGRRRQVYRERLKVGDWNELPGKCTVTFGRYPAIIFGERIAHLLMPDAMRELGELSDELNGIKDVKCEPLSETRIQNWDGKYYDNLMMNRHNIELKFLHSADLSNSYYNYCQKTKTDKENDCIEEWRQLTNKLENGNNKIEVRLQDKCDIDSDADYKNFVSST